LGKRTSKSLSHEEIVEKPSSEKKNASEGVRRRGSGQKTLFQNLPPATTVARSEKGKEKKN